MMLQNTQQGIIQQGNADQGSAREYADIETSSEEYASRFSGPAGEWLLSVQEKILLNYFNQLPAQSPTISILDVGGGHAQIVAPLSKRNLSVTVLGSSPLCRTRLEPFIESGHCHFHSGDLLHLPFADRSFDIVTCFRFLPHCDEWQRLISELCRVTRQVVIVDYPTRQSLNALSPMLFTWKKKFERNTRTYTLFSHPEIQQAFLAHDFVVKSRTGEFLLPMVVHRMLNSPTLSRCLELPFKAFGLTNAFGSPVISVMQRNTAHSNVK